MVTLPTQPQDQKCPECRGKGEIPNLISTYDAKMLTCPTCHGTGKAPQPQDPRDEAELREHEIGVLMRKLGYTRQTAEEHVTAGYTLGDILTDYMIPSDGADHGGHRRAICEAVMAIRKTDVDHGIEIARALISSALQQQREADDAAFEKAWGGKEDSYIWHTSDTSMHNHMRTARNDLRAEAHAAWNKYRKESK